MGRLTEAYDFLTIHPDKLRLRWPYSFYYHHVDITPRLKRQRRKLKLWENICNC